jgi:hypothetical protein
MSLTVSKISIKVTIAIRAMEPKREMAELGSKNMRARAMPKARLLTSQILPHGTVF